MSSSIPPPPTPLVTPSASSSGSGHQKNGSRESSEFEFLGNGNGGGGKIPLPPAVVKAVSPSPPILPPQPSPAMVSAPESIPASSGNDDAATIDTTIQEPKSETPLPKQISDQTGDTVTDEGGSGLFGWVKGAGGGLLSKVAEKTKNSVETMITTLDPQMKEYIYSGGDIEIVVASDRDAKVVPIRESFQNVFGRATVVGLPAHPAVSVAEQPVGYAAGRQGALERIQSFRSKGTVSPSTVVVAVEGFLLEVGEDRWVELSCLLLSDAQRKIQLTAYSQATPVDASFVQTARERTPEAYPKRWSGLAATVGDIVAGVWQVDRSQWHEAVCGVKRSEMIGLAAKSLAGIYQRALATVEQEQLSSV